MTNINNSETITLTILPQENGQYTCQISTSLTDFPTDDRQYYGQTKAHVIAIVLEQLADNYRRIAEEQQNIDWDTVEKSASGEAITKQYHVILHYERIGEAESKFEAMHDTLMGNTVVENAKITIIEIDPDIPVNHLTRRGY